MVVFMLFMVAAPIIVKIILAEIERREIICEDAEWGFSLPSN